MGTHSHHYNNCTFSRPLCEAATLQEVHKCIFMMSLQHTLFSSAYDVDKYKMDRGGRQTRGSHGESVVVMDIIISALSF